jgi:hypothetical protein
LLNKRIGIATLDARVLPGFLHRLDPAARELSAGGPERGGNATIEGNEEP